MKEVMIRYKPTDAYEHEFNISNNNELWTSDNKIWTSSARNKKAISAEDNGNGYIISMHDTGKLITLCYEEATQLYILLSELVDVNIDFVEKTIVKSI